MKSSPSVLIIAVCLGSLVAALVATLMAAPEATDMTTSSPQRVVAELPKELFEQLRDLERRNEALQERITALENGPVETKRFGDKATVTREELDAVASRVEELLEGRTLHRLLRDDGPMPAERAMHVARQVCRSLREAHGLGALAGPGAAEGPHGAKKRRHKTSITSTTRTAHCWLAPCCLAFAATGRLADALAVL